MIMGAKVKYKFLCFVIFALFLKFDARTRSQDLCPFLISETGLKFIIWNLGEIQPCLQSGSCEEALSSSILITSAEVLPVSSRSSELMNYIVTQGFKSR